MMVAAGMQFDNADRPYIVNEKSYAMIDGRLIELHFR